MRPPPSLPPAIAALNEDDITTPELGRGSCSSTEERLIMIEFEEWAGKGGKLTPH
jgi:hypothetical protein